MGESRRRRQEKLTRSEDDVHRSVVLGLAAIGHGESGALAAFLAATRGRASAEIGRGLAVNAALAALSDRPRSDRLGIAASDLAAARVGAVRVVESGAAVLGRAYVDSFQKAAADFGNFLTAAEIGTTPLGLEVRLQPLQVSCSELRDVLSRLHRALDDLERAAPPLFEQEK